MNEQDRPQNAETTPPGEPDAVIVGIDGSPPSRNALAWAIREAKYLDKPIRLVGAYTIPSVAAAAIDVSYVPIDDTSIRAAVTNTLKEAAAEVKAAGVPVEAVIEIGDAAGVLIDESKSGSLAVVGSRGRGDSPDACSAPSPAHCLPTPPARPWSFQPRGSQMWKGPLTPHPPGLSARTASSSKNPTPMSTPSKGCVSMARSWSGSIP